MDDWVSRFAAEERTREEAESRASAKAADRLQTMRFHVRTQLDLLDARVAQDVQAFAREFPERAVTMEKLSEGGFRVHRDHYPHVTLTVEPHWDTASLHASYVFVSQAGKVAPKPIVLELDERSGQGSHFWHDAGQHTFRSLEQLSEYLLVPVFTGRPR
jgi:hypothetical protein